MRLIDADELKKVFIGNRYGTRAIEYYIDNAPIIDAEPVRHGHWAKDMGGYWCSMCNAYFADVEYGYEYCPLCGAKMDEEVENGKED